MSLPPKCDIVLPRPCNCGIVTGPDYTPDQCHLCWLVTYNPRFSRQWSGPSDVRFSDMEQAAVARDESYLCQFRKERVRLLDCKCATKPIVFRCDAPENTTHECTLWKQHQEPAIPGCKGCPWRVAPEDAGAKEKNGGEETGKKTAKKNTRNASRRQR